MNKTTFATVRVSLFSKIFGWVIGLFIWRRPMTVAEIYFCIERARVLKRCRELERKCERLQKEKIAGQTKLDEAIVTGKRAMRKAVREEVARTRMAEKKIESLESAKAILEAEVKLLTQIMEKYGHREELETATLIAKREMLTNPPQR